MDGGRETVRGSSIQPSRRRTKLAAHAAGRTCGNPDCTTRLARDNGGPLCSPCQARVNGYPVVVIDPAIEDDPINEILEQICESPVRRRLESDNRGD